MKPKEECGIVAVCALKNGAIDYSNNDVCSVIPLMLQDMQNRGELSVGTTTYNKKRSVLLKTYKALGTVKEAFKSNSSNQKEIFKSIDGSLGIGHIRYATSGKDDITYAQPFEREHGRLRKWFSFAFNGNISNHNKLRDSLVKKYDYHIRRDTDTEIFMHYLSRGITKMKRDSIEEYKILFKNLSQELDGAYCLAFIDASGRLIIVRDSQGFKPLSYVVTEDRFMVASESVAIWNQGENNIQTLEAGCMLVVDKDGVHKERYVETKKLSHCFFEWIYFSNVASIIEGSSVYQARTLAGIELAKQEKLEIDKNTIVVSVPDTAKASGDALGYRLGVRVVEGIFRNRYVGRSFIQEKDRHKIVRQKFTPLPEILKGKKVLLVEDSIVRGTTLKHIIQDMKVRGQVAQIHLRIACPAIVSPCFYGIDMSTLTELFARDYIGLECLNGDIEEEKLAQMAKDLGADSLSYLPVSSLSKVIGIDEDKLCMACVTSKYPTNYGTRLFSKAKEKALQGLAGRTYDN